MIIEGDRVALIKRKRLGRTYYLFPGGQIEPGESSEVALIREIKEELGLVVVIGRPLAEVIFEGIPQMHYAAQVVGGVFGTGDGDEMSSAPTSQVGSYEPVWMPLTDLKLEPVFPTFVVDLIFDSLVRGWPSEVLYFVEDK